MWSSSKYILSDQKDEYFYNKSWKTLCKIVGCVRMQIFFNIIHIIIRYKIFSKLKIKPKLCDVAITLFYNCCPAFLFRACNDFFCSTHCSKRYVSFFFYRKLTSFLFQTFPLSSFIMQSTFRLSHIVVTSGHIMNRGLCYPNQCTFGFLRSSFFFGPLFLYPQHIHHHFNVTNRFKVNLAVLL